MKQNQYKYITDHTKVNKPTKTIKPLDTGLKTEKEIQEHYNPVLFSAADLVKKSAAQIIFLYYQPQETVITEQMRQGEQYADDYIKQNNLIAEMGRFVSFRDWKAGINSCIYFSVDAIKTKTHEVLECYEIKHVNNNEASEWFFKSSLHQCIFYSWLVNHSSSLKTPKFRLDAGFPKESYNIFARLHPINYYLIFGDKKYQITNPEQSKENNLIANHYAAKSLRLAEIIRTSKDLTEALEEARNWDYQYKFTQYDLFDYDYVEIDKPISATEKYFTTII